MASGGTYFGREILPWTSEISGFLASLGLKHSPGIAVPPGPATLLLTQSHVFFP